MNDKMEFVRVFFYLEFHNKIMFRIQHNIFLDSKYDFVLKIVIVSFLPRINTLVTIG